MVKANPDRSFASSSFGVYELLSVFALASEGKTLRSSESALEQERMIASDVGDAVKAVQDDVYREGQTPFINRNGVFMIWPILMSREFQDQARHDLHTDLIRLGSAGVRSQNEINDWTGGEPIVKKLTKQMIFLSVNSSSIKGEWEEGFDPSLTEERAFLGSGGKVRLPMMEKAGNLLVSEGEGWLAVTLPYAKSLVSATFVLPEDQSVESLVQNISGPSLAKMIKGKPAPVTLTLPKFSTKNDLSLRGASKDFGGHFLFESPIDLRYMSIEMQGDYPMESWTQRVSVEFGEAGGKPKGGASGGHNVVFDKPFLWLISDSKEGVVLASGIFRGRDQAQ